MTNDHVAVQLLLDAIVNAKRQMLHICTSETDMRCPKCILTKAVEKVNALNPEYNQMGPDHYWGA